MRYLKLLLTAVYLYIGVFFAVCLICWIVTGEEPTALIAGVSAATGVESIIAGCIRIKEIREETKREGREHVKESAEDDMGEI